MTALPDIPFEDLGNSGWDKLLHRHRDRAQELIRQGRKLVHPMPLQALDGLSRRWAQKCDHHHYATITRMAKNMPSGLWFMNFCYEWGCTTRVGLDANSGKPIMLRSLDWPFDGIGRTVVMAKKNGQTATPYFAATWPGYTGVITGMKPKRFAIAINQAPLSAPIQFLVANWSIARGRVWRSRSITPGHLVEKVFEETEDFDEAKRRLCETPIALPVIFSLVGVKPGECCVIERMEHSFRLRNGDAVAANHWESYSQRATARGADSPGRATCLASTPLPPEKTFSWAIPPVLNGDTRLAAEISPAESTFHLRGYEKDGPATKDFDLAEHMSDTRSRVAQKI